MATTKPVVRARVGRDGKGVRTGVQGRVQHRVRNGMAGNGDVRLMSEEVGRPRDEDLSAPRWPDALGRAFVLGIVALTLLAIAVTVLLMLWIIVDFLAKSLMVLVTLIVLGMLAITLHRHLTR